MTYQAPPAADYSKLLMTSAVLVLVGVVIWLAVESRKTTTTTTVQYMPAVLPPNVGVPISMPSEQWNRPVERYYNF